jgi:4-hydroxy-tetrahydrodipicolinate synthase
MPAMLFQGSVRAGQTAYTSEVLAALAQLPNVVAIKEGSWETNTYEANRRLVKEVAPRVAVMASGDEHLFSCYVLGSEGSLVSLAVVIPEPIVALDRAVRRGDLDAARKVHEVIYPLAKAIYGAPPGGHANARLKMCLKLLGRLDCAAVRPPIGQLDTAEVAMLREALSAAGVL